jgi:hypothetical protein
MAVREATNDLHGRIIPTSARAWTPDGAYFEVRLQTPEAEQRSPRSAGALAGGLCVGGTKPSRLISSRPEIISESSCIPLPPNRARRRGRRRYVGVSLEGDGSCGFPPYAPRFIFIFFSLLFLFPSLAHAGEVIDGIAATVNGTAILFSDVDESVRYEALLEGHSPATADAAQREAVLQRLIDQELLREQMADSIPPIKAAELTARIQQVRCSAGISCESEPSTAGRADADQAWQKLLASYGLAEEELAERLSAQMQLTAFIESRLQPSVRIDSASVQTYYQEKLLPELHQRGIQTDPPLAQVSRQIEEILRQQRVDQMLSTWLQSLRQQSRIQIGIAATKDR